MVDTHLLTERLHKLRKVEVHVASLELAHARPTLLPSIGGSRESLIRRQRTLALLNDHAEVVGHRLMRLDLSSSLWGQDSRDTGSMLSPTQSGSSSWEPSPMLPLGRGRYHCTASCFSSGRAQPTWIRKPSSTTPLAETPGAGSRGGSAPRCLPWQLGRQTEPRSRLQSHKAPSRHQAPLQQIPSRSSGKGSAQIMVGDHGHTLSGSPAERPKLARIA